MGLVIIVVVSVRRFQQFSSGGNPDYRRRTWWQLRKFYNNGYTKYDGNPMAPMAPMAPRNQWVKQMAIIIKETLALVKGIATVAERQPVKTCSRH